MVKKNTGLIAAFVIIFISGYFISAYFDTGGQAGNPVDSVHAIVAQPYPMPDNLSFAGEKMPLNDIDLKERYDKEILSNAYFHSNTLLLMKKSGRWFPIMTPILNENNIPLDFLYLPLVESGLSNVVSPRGAVGFWQLTEGSARELGLTVNSEIDERYNPVRSTEAACTFLLKAKEKFGSWTNAAAAYNMGMHALDKSMEMQKMDSYYDLLLNDETSRYIFRILAIKEIFTNPERYLAEYALSLGLNYKLLKRYNPWLRTNHLTIKDPSGSIIINIPVNHPVYSREVPPAEDSLMIGDDRYPPEE